MRIEEELTRLVQVSKWKFLLLCLLKAHARGLRNIILIFWIYEYFLRDLDFLLIWTRFRFNDVIEFPRIKRNVNLWISLLANNIASFRLFRLVRKRSLISYIIYNTYKVTERKSIRVRNISVFSILWIMMRKRRFFFIFLLFGWIFGFFVGLRLLMYCGTRLMSLLC